MGCLILYNKLHDLKLDWFDKMPYFLKCFIQKNIQTIKFALILSLNKSYDDSVKLKRTEIDLFRLG